MIFFFELLARGKRKVVNNKDNGLLMFFLRIGLILAPLKFDALINCDVAVLVRAHMNNLLPFESTIEQTTETMPPPLTTKQ